MATPDGGRQRLGRRQAPRMVAALAYYSVFSVTPLLVLAIGIGGLVFDQDVARKAVLREIQTTVGEPAASTLDAMVQNVHNDGHSVWATLIGLATLLIGAVGVFGELQETRRNTGPGKCNVATIAHFGTLSANGFSRSLLCWAPVFCSWCR